MRAMSEHAATYPCRSGHVVTFITLGGKPKGNLCNHRNTEDLNTMTHEVETTWMGKMQFNALVGGHTVTMDAPERAGGEDLGPIPKPFMLTALSGCTGMDVVALLRKAGKQLERFEVKVSGEISKTPPILYTRVHVLYDMHGDPADQEDALAVVQRSQNEICGVSAMMKKAMPVTWEVQYNDVTVFNTAVVGSTAV